MSNAMHVCDCIKSQIVDKSCGLSTHRNCIMRCLTINRTVAARCHDFGIVFPIDNNYIIIVLVNKIFVKNYFIMNTRILHRIPLSNRHLSWPVSNQHSRCLWTRGLKFWSLHLFSNSLGPLNPNIRFILLLLLLFLCVNIFRMGFQGKCTNFYTRAHIHLVLNLARNFTRNLNLKKNRVRTRSRLSTKLNESLKIWIKYLIIFKQPNWKFYPYKCFIQNIKKCLPI